MCGGASCIFEFEAYQYTGDSNYPGDGDVDSPPAPSSSTTPASYTSHGIQASGSRPQPQRSLAPGPPTASYAYGRQISDSDSQPRRSQPTSPPGGYDPASYTHGVQTLVSDNQPPLSQPTRVSPDATYNQTVTVEVESASTDNFSTCESSEQDNNSNDQLTLADDPPDMEQSGPGARRVNNGSQPFTRNESVLERGSSGSLTMAMQGSMSIQPSPVTNGGTGIQRGSSEPPPVPLATSRDTMLQRGSCSSIRVDKNTKSMPTSTQSPDNSRSHSQTTSV